MPVTAAVGVSAGGVVGDDPGHVGSHVDAALVDQSGAAVVAIEPVELPVPRRFEAQDLARVSGERSEQ